MEPLGLWVPGDEGRPIVQKLVASVALGVALMVVPTTAAGAQKTSDKDLAQAGVFQASDFPAGWLATPHTSKSDANACPPVRKALQGAHKLRTAKADSDDYAQGNEQYTSSTVVLRTDDGARLAYKVLTSGATRRCITRIVKDEVQSKASQQGLDVKTEAGTITGSSSYGDESSAIGLKFTFTKGISVDLFGELVFVRVGRTIGLYTRTSDSEVDKECGASSTTDCLSFKGLITAAAGRLANTATA